MLKKRPVLLSILYSFSKICRLPCYFFALFFFPRTSINDVQNEGISVRQRRPRMAYPTYGRGSVVARSGSLTSLSHLAGWSVDSSSLRRRGRERGAVASSPTAAWCELKPNQHQLTERQRHMKDEVVVLSVCKGVWDWGEGDYMTAKRYQRDVKTWPRVIDGEMSKRCRSPEFL